MNRSLVPHELLDPVVAYFAPRQVILFGSAARGGLRPDSDLDLLVVVDDDTPPSRLTLAAGYESRRGYHGPVDVIPVRQSVFRRKAKVAGTIPFEAAQDGIVVYERP